MKKTDDSQVILSLWQEAFGDSEAEIRFFLDNVKNGACYFYEDEGAPAAMLFAVRCRLNGMPAAYIYAACTAEQKRKQGCMSALLEECKAQFDRLCLIPASDSLVTYYQNRGFQRRAPIESLAFDECDAVKEDLLEGYQLTEPTVLYYEREHYGL